MRNKFLCIFLGLTFSVSSFVFAVNSVNDTNKRRFPSYETIVTTFANNYLLARPNESFSYEFEKRIDGWYVCYTEFDANPDKVERMLFWDANTGKYLKLDLITNLDNESNYDMIENYLDRSTQIHCYNTCPYYGYDGWEVDVIKDFKDFDSLSDTLLYSVARAYVQYATNLIIPLDFSKELDYNFHLELTDYKMTDSQLQEYLKFHQTGIDLFNRVYKLNPEFNTIVGSCQTKAANETVLMWLNIAVFRDVETAAAILPNDIYSENMLSYAKNYLNSCAPNAILLTFGDNDFFPILYLQNKLNYRTDVLVLCFPFMNSKWYLDFLTDRNINGGTMPLLLDKSIYLSPLSAVLYNSYGVPKGYISVDSLLNLISYDESFKDGDDGYSYFLYKSNNLYFPADPEKIIAEGLVCSEDKDRIETRLEFSCNEGYLLRNEIVILDLLRTVNWTRPFYSTTVNKDYPVGLHKYFQNSGFAYKFVPIKSEEKMYINSDSLYNYLINDLIWFNIDSIEDYEIKNINVNMTIVGFRKRFSDLAIQLLNEGDTIKAKEVMGKCETLMPIDKFQPSIYEIEYAKALLITGDYSEAERYVFILGNPIMDDLSIYYEMSKKDRAKYQSEIILDLEQINYINYWGGYLGLENVVSLYTEFYDMCIKRFELEK